MRSPILAGDAGTRDERNSEIHDKITPRGTSMAPSTKVDNQEVNMVSEVHSRSPRGLPQKHSEKQGVADVSPRSPRALQLREEEIQKLLEEKEEGKISLKSPRSPRMPAQSSNLNNIKKKLHLKSKSEVMSDAMYLKDNRSTGVSPRASKPSSLKANVNPNDDSPWTKELAQRCENSFYVFSFAE